MTTINNPLDLFDISDKIVVIGYSGSGKTYFMKKFIEYSNIKPMYIIDPIGNFSPNPSWKNFDYSGIVPCSYPDDNHICIKMNNTAQFEALIKYLSYKKGEWFLVVDEIDRFLDVYPAPYYAKRYLEEGRNYGRGGIFSVRRLGFLNKSILSNAHYLVMFKVNNTSDLKYLSSMIDIPLNKLNFSQLHSFYVFDLHKSENLGYYILK
ncbi:MAG: hypothetical protein QXV17_08245 [Candidatus Micrarchaeaceae archaeon]